MSTAVATWVTCLSGKNKISASQLKNKISASQLKGDTCMDIWSFSGYTALLCQTE